MASDSLQRFLQKMQQLVGQGELQLALEQLQNYLAAGDNKLHRDIILLTARYNRLRREVQQGTLTREESRVERTILENNVLEFLDEIPRRITAQMSPTSLPMPEILEVPLPEDVRLEKILGINNLKQIAWLEQGISASRCVCRILTPTGLGTGFLIGANLLITNHHVIPSSDVAAESWAELNYQLDFAGGSTLSHRYSFDRDPRRFHTNPLLDYTIVGIAADPSELDAWGFLRLNPHADPVPGEHVAIIQHPNGGPKQIALTANQVFHLKGHLLHYTTDTMPGSSGSPIFNDLWQVIAIHHAYGGLQANSKGDKRFVNEGVLMSAIKADAGPLWPNPEP
jgi:V8-like Glu-specific endopeptidase